MPPFSVPAHHSEPGDPVLLEWIMHQLNALLGIGPMGMVLAFGVIIVATPIAVTAAVLLMRLRQSRP